MRRLPFITATPSRRRFACATVAMLALIGQLVSLAHLTMVQHAVCLEHGELVHSDVRGRWNAPPADSDAAAVHATDATSSGDHDHCGARAYRRESTLVAPSSMAPEKCAKRLEIADFSATESRFGGQPIYRLAPKCSPPA
jgi:hypothetical protein